MKKTVIGITGNIASGKSVVRQYLENAGAVTVDADLVAQETYLPCNPAYQPILDEFGDDLIMSDGLINRGKLGRLVFQDLRAMRKLEEIVHPLVLTWIAKFINESSSSLVVIEAIKVFESGLNRSCDQVWTVVADDQVRADRLVNSRGLSEEAAYSRIQSQKPQEEKARLSDWVISTNGSFADTYRQVLEGMRTIGSFEIDCYKSPNNLDYRSLSQMDFAQASELFAADSEKIWVDEDFYRLLGTKSVLACLNSGRLNQVTIWQISQYLAIINAHRPYKPKITTGDSTLEALTYFAKQHECTDLIISKDLLNRHDAKQQGFLLGEDLIDGINPLIYTSFLRKHGLMPGEVYQKPLL